jgi:hypothetical protein
MSDRINYLESYTNAQSSLDIKNLTNAFTLNYTPGKSGSASSATTSKAATGGTNSGTATASPTGNSGKL